MEDLHIKLEDEELEQISRVIQTPKMGALLLNLLNKNVTNTGLGISETGWGPRLRPSQKDGSGSLAKVWLKTESLSLVRASYLEKVRFEQNLEECKRISLAAS